MSRCIFCDILVDKAPANKIYHGTASLGIVPLNPCTPGHVIFISNRHVKDASESPFTAASVMYDVAKFINNNPGDYNILTSIGSIATQTVFHLHVHLVPRRENDGLKLPWTED